MSNKSISKLSQLGVKANSASATNNRGRSPPPLVKSASTSRSVTTSMDLENKPKKESVGTLDDQDNDKTDTGVVKEPETVDVIPDVYKTQGMATYSSCTGYSETTCLCSSVDDSSSPINKRVTYLERRNWITTERLCDLRKKAQDAIKNHRTFTIRGCFYSIRKGLLLRGWVEKLDIHRKAPIHGSCQVVLEEVTQTLPLRRPGETRRQHIQKCERNIMSRFLEHIPIDFLWSARKEKSDWIDMARNPSITINKFHKSPFTTKEGLCNVLRDLHWFVEEGKSETYYPRSYNVWNQEELAEFVDDFRITACMSLLRFVVERQKTSGLESLWQNDGQVPLSCIRFALNQCQIHIRCSLHYDIDEDFDRVWDHDWEIFLTHYQMLIQENAKFQNNELNELKSLADDAKQVLNEANEHWPQSILDGVFSIWIIKPSNRCRGRGIHLMSDLKKIINYVNPPIVNKGRYVVQKYIERPLIIHNCKFDIRQWFLVTSVQPLIVWMYKESYLRFSSQEYDLVNFHESVHLTNHAVQKRYKNGKRDERLPPENMWDCYTFQAYLRQIGKADEWADKIYPGMQKALIGTLLASQDTMDRRLNTFELFGADFMLSEDCQPWLIEINASPDLGGTTSVTARLCPQCLEDVIKVVVDYRNDPKASTGGFELIYRQVIPPAPAYLGLNLFLKGTQILPKNGAGKREKSKDLLRLRNEMRPLMEYNHKDPTGPDILTPRPFIIDLIDCISSKNDVNRTPRKGSKMRALMPTKRSNNLNPIGKENANSDSPRKWSSSLSRQYSTVAQIDMSRRRLMAKANELTRRNVSCGPRLPIAAPVDDNVKSDTEINNNINSNPSERKPLESTELSCVGSKCSGDTETIMPVQPPSNGSSSHKQSLETPRLFPNKPKLKPLNIVNSSNTNKCIQPTGTSNKSATKFLSANNREYRKYVNHLQMSKLQPKSAVNDGYCSHFFAVGLSLRAWRSKYNQMLKSQNDKVEFTQSYGAPNSSRRSKKLESK